MSKYIVITTIHDPTRAVVQFAAREGYRLVVVADKKTPPHWQCQYTDFISLEQQKVCKSRLASLLPYNHYSRKMLGYLHAIQSGAEVIVDTDDDNVPKADWSFPEFDGSYEVIHGAEGFVNVYEFYTDQRVWPRGYPLRLLEGSSKARYTVAARDIRVGVWQGLADEEPDVDAVYRLTSNELCYFSGAEARVLQTGVISPFNSQNTAFREELFPLLYLPAFVTFRFTDILRGLVAQPIMWACGYHLGFVGATVVQHRNPHDYMQDFLSEIPMYINAERVCEIVSSAISSSASLADNMRSAYEALAAKEIVPRQEIDLLNAWLADCGRASV